jgi:hypothetical protein
LKKGAFAPFFIPAESIENDTVVRQAKPSGKHYTLKDSDGLALFVSATGCQELAFPFRGLLASRVFRSAPIPNSTSKMHVNCVIRRRTLVARGIDPRAHRQHQRTAALLTAGHTFEAVFCKWVNHRRLGLKECHQSTLAQILWIFGKDILPSLRTRSICDIARADLLAVLGKNRFHRVQ